MNKRKKKMTGKEKQENKQWNPYNKGIQERKEERGGEEVA